MVQILECCRGQFCFLLRYKLNPLHIFTDFSKTSYIKKPPYISELFLLISFHTFEISIRSSKYLIALKFICCFVFKKFTSILKRKQQNWLRAIQKSATVCMGINESIVLVWQISIHQTIHSITSRTYVESTAHFVYSRIALKIA